MKMVDLNDILAVVIMSFYFMECFHCVFIFVSILIGKLLDFLWWFLN